MVAKWTPAIAAKDAIDVLKTRILVDGFHLVVDLEKCHGSYLFDGATGREYLDFYSNFASQPMGMAVDPVALAPPPVIENPLLTRAALQEKAEREQAEIQQRRQALLGGSLASTFA